MTHDRRRHTRHVVNSPVVVNLGEGATGLLFDLSEGGLAIDVLGSVKKDQIVPIRFSLPDRDSCIEASGQVVWIDEAARRVGIRFVDLPERAHQDISEWLSLRATVPTAPRKTPEGPTSSRPAPREGPSVAQPTRASRSSRVSEYGPSLAAVKQRNIGRSGVLLSARHVVGLVVVFVLICGVIFALGYFVGRSHDAQVRAAPDSDNIQPAETTEAAPKPQPSFSETDRLLTPPLIPHGAIVLQVAALTRQADALALAESLRKKEYPAFVLTPTTDHFYRVQLGPYADVDSAKIARHQLTKDGLKTIVKR